MQDTDATSEIPNLHSLKYMVMGFRKIMDEEKQLKIFPFHLALTSFASTKSRLDTLFISKKTVLVVLTRLISEYL